MVFLLCGQCVLDGATARMCTELLRPVRADVQQCQVAEHDSRFFFAASSQIHQQMRHPRIVNLTDVFEICCDSFATVLDYCRGTDLECLLREREQLPERDARALVLQVARGLQYLNTAQVRTYIAYGGFLQRMGSNSKSM